MCSNLCAASFEEDIGGTKDLSVFGSDNTANGLNQFVDFGRLGTISDRGGNVCRTSDDQCSRFVSGKDSADRSVQHRWNHDTTGVKVDDQPPDVTVFAVGADDQRRIVVRVGRLQRIISFGYIACTQSVLRIGEQRVR